jgi:hypothetical protein
VRVKAGLIAAVAGFSVLTSNALASNPNATGAANASTVAPGRSTLLTVAVTPGADPASTGVFVSCNLSSIGGEFSQMFADDGTNGDPHAGDLAFSYRATVSPTTALGPRSLPCVVSDAQGRSTFAQIALMVDAVPNQPPTADAGGPYDVNEGSTLVLDAAGSDPEGGPLTFAWDLDGDGVFETPTQSPSLLLEDGPAVRTVKVRVTDDAAATAVAMANVTVDNVAPSALFHAPSQAGAVFQLSLSDPFDPSLADTAAGFTYAFDCGSGYGAYGDSAAASCPGGSVALHVGGRVRDKDGGVSEYRATVAVETVQSTPTFTGLCELTRSLSHKPRVARSLCRKLAKAAHAKSAKQRRHQLRAYRAEVRAQTGWKRSKAFRPPDGARLQALARQLERA